MRSLTAVPISAEAFAPFGQLLQAPAKSGRDYFNEALASSRPAAIPSLSVTHTPQFDQAAITVKMMERHEFSSQTFIPMNVSRYVIIVAPHLPGGGPDADAAQAFMVLPHQAITYAQNVWHYPMTVLDQDSQLAVVMWTDSAGGDEEFVPIDPPFQVRWEN